MAYIGKAPNTAIVNQTTSQSFNGTGSATAFTLNRSVNVGEDLEVFVNNVQQEPGSGKSYTASGTTLTFDEAPPSGTGNVYVIYRGEATINPRLEHDANSALAATTGTFTGAFTSPGIDDNADATAITIDSSENVLVDKTSSNYQTVGHELRDGGRAFHTADGSKTLSLNRLSSDGGILDFYKDNTEVGNVQSRSGVTSFFVGDVRTSGAGGASLHPIGGNTPSIRGGNHSALVDNYMDLGSSGNRFKDLYLGGNLDVGGTGRANALDDYETGTFTPNFTGASGGEASYSVREGSYTKVGRLVVAHVIISLSSKNTLSGSVQINNLPFTVSNLLTSTSVEASGSVGYFAGLATAASSMVTFPMASTINSQFHFVSGTSSTSMGSLDTSHLNNNFNLRATVTYFTT